MQSPVTEAISINDEETLFYNKKGFFVIKVSNRSHPKHPRLEIAIATDEIKSEEP
ncbi:hypothetical protein [Coleofasciculus sp. H7-2]|uniref:hypothetical protein n=1 Tax=Coleofasciculus sp. H7-2 TaxID=3351545 RepID=UPI00366E31D1